MDLPPSGHSTTDTSTQPISESPAILNTSNTSEPDLECGTEHDSAHEPSPEAEDNTLPPINHANIFTRIRHLPLSACFLVLTDISERFSYYSFSNILFLYFSSFEFLSANTARIMYHLFIIGSYLSPIPGAWLADDKFGRYPVILAFVSVYLVGLGILTLASALTVAGQVTQLVLSLAALGLIAVGVGGIKPTASSLGADQLRTPLQHLLLPFFFSVWYYATNLGAIAGAVLTPAIRNAFGYSYAFLSAFVLLFIALAVFLLGRKRYYRVPPSPTPLISDLSKVFLSAVRNRFRRTPRQPSVLPDISALPLTEGGSGSSDHGMGGSMIGHSSRGALSAHVAPDPVSLPVSEMAKPGWGSEVVSGVVSEGDSATGVPQSLPLHLGSDPRASDGAINILSHLGFHHHATPHTQSLHPEPTQDPQSYTFEARPAQHVPIPQHSHLPPPLDVTAPGAVPQSGGEPLTTALGHYSLPRLDPVDPGTIPEPTDRDSRRAIHAGAESEPTLAHLAHTLGRLGTVARGPSLGALPVLGLPRPTLPPSGAPREDQDFWKIIVSH